MINLNIYFFLKYRWLVLAWAELHQDELKDISLFKSAKVSFDTVKWENEADIDTETLHEDSVPYNIS